MQGFKLLAIAVTGAVLSACGASPNHTHTPDSTDASDVRNDARVQVTNNNWSDVRVYVERDGVQIRLGAVTTMATEVFRLPRTLMETGGAIRLIADPIGANDSHTTHSLLVWPGQMVSYTIANDLAISWATVRR